MRYSGNPGRGTRMFCPGLARTEMHRSRAQEQPLHKITSCWYITPQKNWISTLNSFQSGDICKSIEEFPDTCLGFNCCPRYRNVSGHSTSRFLVSLTKKKWPKMLTIFEEIKNWWSAFEFQIFEVIVINCKWKSHLENHFRVFSSLSFRFIFLTSWVVNLIQQFDPICLSHLLN